VSTSEGRQAEQDTDLFEHSRSCMREEMVFVVAGRILIHIWLAVVFIAHQHMRMLSVSGSSSLSVA
jgi:hypothetical protein